MCKFQWGIAALILCSLTVVILASSGFFDREHNRRRLANNSAVESEAGSNRSGESKPLTDLLSTDESDMKEVGGVMRPRRDWDFDSAITKPDEPQPSAFRYPGRLKALKGDENEEVAGLFEEIQKPEPHPAAQSSFFKPEPFELEAFQQNPQEYIRKIRSGRVFQPHQPGPDIKPLVAQSKLFQRALQGETVLLSTQADPGMPVAYYAPGAGTFKNQLKSVTVIANDDGIATAELTVGPGSVGLVSALAASPVHSEQLAFHVLVSLPN